MKESYAKYLLNKTKKDYQLILDKFSDTRKFVWRDLFPLLNYAKKEDKVLDLGCGNGRLFEVLKNVNYTGIDNVPQLIEEAKEQFPEGNFKTSDALDLPFSKNTFDKVYSIAVLHHIPSKKYRERFLKEAKRVLKPNGLLFLTVWNLWNMKDKRKIIMKYSLLKLVGKSKLDFKDIFLDWKDDEGKMVTKRYIRFITKKELKRTVKKAGFEIIESGSLKNDYNNYVIAKKT